MPRPKTQSREEIIKRAKAAFWQHGYRNLSIRALEEAGIARSTLRAEFGDKEGMFREVLRSYGADAERYVFAPLRERSDLGALEEMLDGAVTPYPDSCRHFGCLMVNTAVENAAAGSDELRALTETHFDTLRNAVSALVSRAAAAGEARTDVDPMMAGDYVAGCVTALNVINRNAADVTAAKGFVGGAKETIEGWRS